MESSTVVATGGGESWRPKSVGRPVSQPPRRADKSHLCTSAQVVPRPGTPSSPHSASHSSSDVPLWGKLAVMAQLKGSSFKLSREGPHPGTLLSPSKTWLSLCSGQLPRHSPAGSRVAGGRGGGKHPAAPVVALLLFIFESPQVMGSLGGPARTLPNQPLVQRVVEGR